jgi:hypothetical protein
MQPNPYDWRGPVVDPKRFSGRDAELHFVDYALSFLVKNANGATPINLAVIGDRASGKTSFLNVVKIKAGLGGTIAAKLDLDEEVAARTGSFFGAIFFALFDSVSANCGTANSVLSPDVVEGCRQVRETGHLISGFSTGPFRLPSQLACTSSDVTQATAGVDAFVQDVSLLQEISQKPLVIILDECDALAGEDRLVVLQRLRSAMARLPHCMFVLAGTRTFEESLVEVFSSVMRQFKIIRLSGFSDYLDTFMCIVRPLLESGVTNLKEILEPRTASDIGDIHDLCSGRPYEVQLLAFYMYKQVEDALADKMRLSVDVLEAARRELDHSMEASTRPALEGLRHLTSKALKPLRVFCECDGKLSLEQVCNTEYCFFGETRFKRSDLKQAFDIYENEGILKFDKGVIIFNGDPFDKLYTKFYCAEKRVTVWFPDFSKDQLLWVKLSRAMQKNEDLKEFPFVSTEPDETNLQTGFDLLRDGTKLGDADEEDLGVVRDVYLMTMESYRLEPTVLAAEIELHLNGRSCYRGYYYPNPRDQQRVHALPDYVNSMNARAMEVGGSVTLEIREWACLPWKTMEENLVQYAPKHFLTHMGYLILKGTKQLLEDDRKNIDEARFLAERSLRIADAPFMFEAEQLLGYLDLCDHNLDKAETHLLKANEFASRDDFMSRTITDYDLAVLATMRGDYALAREAFNKLSDTLRVRPYDNDPGTLLIVSASAGNPVTYEEVDRLPVGEALKRSVEALDVIQRGSTAGADESKPI